LKISRRSNANQNGLSGGGGNNSEGVIHASGVLISFELFNA
jgi:hypothetical protein